MAKTFHKRSGTTDLGKEYEALNVANIAMNLATDVKIKDFYISSNDVDFGDFDDIVVEAQLENGTEHCALQLKHSGRDKLSLNHFSQPKGDFSLKKYFDSWQKITVPKESFKFILYTNKTFEVKQDMKFQLNDEKFFITPSKVSSNNACKILQTDNCYKFSIVKDANCDNSDKILLYEKFFDSFFLYSNQENINNLKLHVTENFKTFFGGNDVESKEYVNFINEWSLQDREIEKLNKKWIQLVIALKIFSSRIKPLSFNFNNDTQNTNIVQRNMLREAIDAFDISIFQNESYDPVRELWNDTKCELEDLKALNKLRTNYQVDSTYISNIAKVDSLTLSVLLWLKGKCPLILKQDASVHKALELCDGKKFILLKNDSFSENTAAFRTLSDLEPKTLKYNQLVQNLTCSLQGKREIHLVHLISGNEDILTAIRTDDLLEMAKKGQCTIAEAQEILPVPYIERSLLKHSIDIKIINNFTKDTQVILDYVSEKNYLNNTFKVHNLVDIDDFLITEIQEERSLNIDSNFGKKAHTEGTTIYLSKKRCEYSEFNTICKKAKNVKHFHQFRLRDDGHLEWIRSKGGVSDLEKYKLSQYYSVQEHDLSSSEFEHNINLLVSDPGMGKSELMKSFKHNCFPDCFTVIIDPKDVYAFLKDTNHGKNYVDIVQKFILDQKFKTLSKRDKDIFRILLKTNKIVYVWDALDELSDQYRNIVTNIIVELSQDCVQWVTSRCHLQNVLERKFNVFSLNLTKFNEQEQSSYIEKRLGGVNSTKAIETIITKIKSSFALVEHKDILGIPLQLFMLTELFRQNQEEYLKLLKNFFPLTDLYKYFIQNKIDIHYKEKLNSVPYTISAASSFQIQKDKLLEEYTNAALKLLFPDAILKELGVQDEQNSQLIEENHKNIGLITEITDQIPCFLHNSFAEYLAACYIAKNLEHKQIQAQNFFEPKYNNVRFFFDLLLAKDSEAHVAVLYKNFSFIQNCDSRVLECTDLGGRSVLHLACSWGQRYSELNVKYTGNTCIIDDEEMYSTVAESNEYLETIDYLLKKCNLSKTDQIYNMTPKEYARKTKCLAAEMRLTMEQDIQKSIESSQIINILYYSTYFGYYQEFIYFFQQFNRNSRQQENGKTKPTLFQDIVIKNNNGMTFLFMAAGQGHFKIVELLIKAGVPINLAANEGSTALFAASLNGHEEIVEFLVQEGAEINLANRDGKTALWIASLNGHEKIVKFLITAGADKNLADNEGKTALWMACLNGHDNIVEFLVETGVDMNLARNDGTTALSKAALIGHEKIVRCLIKAGAGINLANKGGFTALYAASQEGHTKIVECLVEAGAEINFANKGGWTALWIASMNGHDEIVELLVSASASINLADNNGKTALWMASQSGREKIVECLTKAGADMNIASNDGFTALYVASQEGCSKIVVLLVNARAEINFVNKDGRTALWIASSEGNEKIVEILVNAGADINLADDAGKTALWIGSQNGHDKIVEFLIKAGAGINLADNDGKTALWIASQNGYCKIVEFLVKTGADISLARQDNTTALSRASFLGHDKVVEFLINAGASMNLANDGGFTALYAASQEGHTEVVESLVKADAEIDFAREGGWTALWIASSEGYEKIVEILVNAGADINLADDAGKTALWIASQNGHDKIVEFLVKKGADISLARQDNTTALSRASFLGHDKVVELLINAGASINLANDGGFTALYAASQEGHVRVVELLVKAGAEINSARGGGWTALWIASMHGHDKIVEILVEAGADIDLADNDGLTPLHVASQQGHEQIVEFLLKEQAKINLPYIMT